jgi:2-polyprenyl-3-methyl-5-hydroxy-6-metoxy-1,4-benzoquinol methylase
MCNFVTLDKLDHMNDYKAHWEKIYSTKNSDEVSWTQKVPSASLGFIHSFGLPKDAAIIDVGGGESKFVDFLLEEGYTNITVLDISEQALKKAQAKGIESKMDCK